MNYKVQHVTNRYKLTNRKMVPNSFTIHSTGNPHSTAQNERDYLNSKSNTNSTGYHIVVDANQAIECIPLDMIAYHAGDGAFGAGNARSIGLEICESGNREKTLKHAEKVTAYHLQKKGWGINKLRRHFDHSGKSCPRILSYNNWKGWAVFKFNVQLELSKLNYVPPKKEGVVVKPVSNEPNAWAKEAWEWATKEGLFDGNNPRQPISREEVSIVLKRLSDAKRI